MPRERPAPIIVMKARKHADPSDVRSGRDIDQHGADPQPTAVTFATREHFTLQGARAFTIAESTGRATMFLSAVSGGLLALGLIATASRVGTAFYAFGLVALPTLAFIGLVTFERVVQSGIAESRRTDDKFLGHKRDRR